MSSTEETELDDAFWALQTPGEWLPPQACITGNAYWVDSREIDGVAICVGVNSFGATTFEGLTNKNGVDQLATDQHHDDIPDLLPVKPYVDLGKAPDFANDNQKMLWLLDQNIDVYQSRLAWMKSLPEALKKSRLYNEADQEEFLAFLLKKKAEGFSTKRNPTTAEILNARAKI